MEAPTAHRSIDTIKTDEALSAEKDSKQPNRFTWRQKGKAVVATGAAGLTLFAGCSSPEAEATNPNTQNPGETTSEVVINDPETGEIIYPLTLVEYLQSDESGYKPDEASMAYIHHLVPYDLDGDGKITGGEEMPFWELNPGGYTIDEIYFNHKAFTHNDAGEIIHFATKDGVTAHEQYVNHVGEYLKVDPQIANQFSAVEVTSRDYESLVEQYAEQFAYQVVDVIHKQTVLGALADQNEIPGRVNEETGQSYSLLTEPYVSALQRSLFNVDVDKDASSVYDSGVISTYVSHASNIDTINSMADSDGVELEPVKTNVSEESFLYQGTVAGSDVFGVTYIPTELEYGDMAIGEDEGIKAVTFNMRLNGDRLEVVEITDASLNYDVKSSDK